MHAAGRRPWRAVRDWGSGLTLSVLAACASGSDDTLVYQFTAAGWLGHMHVREGRFEGCSVSTHSPEGILVAVGLSSGFRLDLVLRNTRWSFEDGGASPVEVAVDGRPIGDATVESSRRTELVLDLGVAWETFESIQLGDALTVDALGNQLRLPLDGSAEAMAGLLNCVQRANEASG